MTTYPPETTVSSTVSRRRFLALLCASVLPACGKDSIVPAALDSVQYAWSGRPDVPLTRAQINELPYASIRAKFGKSPRSLLVLGRYDGEDLHWVSADRGVLVTRHGRLVRTVGFPKNLLRTEMLTPDPVQTGLQKLQEPEECLRLIDLEPGHYFQVPVRSRLERVAAQTIEILGLKFETVHVSEHAAAEALRWEFTNDYWADAKTGAIWRSVQHFAPELPPIEIEILKPAAPLAPA